MNGLSTPTSSVETGRYRWISRRRAVSGVHANVRNHFSLDRHLIDRQTYWERHSAALAEWQVLVS